MTTYFISRHQGAFDWLKQQKHTVDIMQAHLNIEEVQAGDIVIGTLPVHLVAQLCDKGARYFHLVLDLPQEMRGKELSAQDMNKAHVNLKEFIAREL